MAEETTALVPVREETVNFYGDELVALLLEDGTILVPLKPICDFLGLSWNGQRERTRRDPVLNDALQFARVTRVNTAGDPTVLVLPLDMLPGWLFGISESRVKSDLREKIQRYRRECFRVLWQHFQGQVMPSAPPAPATGAEQALALAEAVVEIARQQVELERRHNTMADYMRSFVKDTKTRLLSLELQVGGEVMISDGQAAEIALAVKRVAIARAAQDGGNHYGAVYDALYRRFGVSSYKNIPRSQYDSVLAWLRQQFDEVSGTSDGPGEGRG